MPHNCAVGPLHNSDANELFASNTYTANQQKFMHDAGQISSVTKALKYD